MRPAGDVLEKLVAELDGERYHVAQESQAQQAGGRSWSVKLIPNDQVPPQPFTVPMQSFHEGSGFSYAGVPNTYEIANGWDCSTPGLARSWGRHAVGADVTHAVNYFGFCQFYGDNLYVCRGRYVTKYTPSSTPGETWIVADTKDLGVGNHAGVPIIWSGKLHVPVVVNATGAGTRFWTCTTGSPDTWTQGPADKLCSGLSTYTELLVRWEGSQLATCADNPTVAANWSDDGLLGSMYQAGDPGEDITGMAEWDRLLLVGKERELISFNENFRSINELPDLKASVPSPENGRGMAYTNGVLLVPNLAGLIRWQPQRYLGIGPEQEGGLESDISDGYGMTRAIVPNGRMAFFTSYDSLQGKSTIGAYYPSRGARGPLIPHSHFTSSSVLFEDACLATVDGKLYLVVLAAAADGLTATPWVYDAPLSGLGAATDRNVDHATSSASLKTPRYFAPERGLEKTFGEVRLWAEMSLQSGHPGLQVWASVDGAAFIQLLDGTGAAKTAPTTGAHSYYFPKTAAAVGHYVQLDYRIPALGGGESAVAITLRDMSLRGSYQPDMVMEMTTTFILTKGEFEDRTSNLREPQEQLADLQALAAARTATTPWHDPWGNEGYCQVTSLDWKEIMFKGEEAPTLVAHVVMREEAYA